MAEIPISGDLMRRAEKRSAVGLAVDRATGSARMVYLVTNVLARKALNDQQAAQLYRMRLGRRVAIPLYKQTFGRHGIRSTGRRNARQSGTGLVVVGAVDDSIVCCLQRTVSRCFSAPMQQCCLGRRSDPGSHTALHPGEVCNPRMRFSLAAAVRNAYQRCQQQTLPIARTLRMCHLREASRSSSLRPNNNVKRTERAPPSPHETSP